MSYQKRLMIFLAIISLTLLGMLVYFFSSVRNAVNDLEGNDVEFIPENIIEQK
ncbi:MAG: hypothetical protein WD712_01325 [Candidatus Spechtbacterales bacterium]